MKSTCPHCKQLTLIPANPSNNQLIRTTCSVCGQPIRVRYAAQVPRRRHLNKSITALILVLVVVSGVFLLPSFAHSVLGVTPQYAFNFTVGHMAFEVGSTSIGWDSMHLIGYATWDGQILVVTLTSGTTVTNLHGEGWNFNGTKQATGTITLGFGQQTTGSFNITLV